MAGDQATRYPWYDVVSGPDLQQGDILLDCPVFLIPPEAVREPGEHPITIERQNVIVLSQSCDLALRNDGTCNLEDVSLAAIYQPSELAKDKTFKKKVNWENARKGRYPGYHVLYRCDIPGHELDSLIVDFRRIFSLSVDAVREIAEADGKTRVRLLPPYREHLSQAFARFFMRVGLPVDIPPFR